MKYDNQRIIIKKMTFITQIFVESGFRHILKNLKILLLIFDWGMKILTAA